jgi:hypothetical protein
MMAMDNSLGFVEGGVRILLRAEGFAVLVASTAAFAALHGNWWTFGLLFFTPDVSFLAYLANSRIGAAAYNLLHSYVAPLTLGLLAFWEGAPAVLPIALIWTAHIGFDRAAGYGLKYATAFGHTHLGFLGKESK